MLNEVEKMIGSTINIESGKSFADENRKYNVTKVGDDYKIQYSRDNIKLENKKKIEDEIYNSLTKIGLKEDNIILMSISESTSEIEKSSSTPIKQESASLKTGHGPAQAAKKSVENVKKVIAIASGKGGVGKSTVSVNLAYSLIKSGKKVGLIDADIYGPSIPMMIGKRNDKPQANDNKKIIPLESNGLKVVSFGNFIPEGDPVIWRGPMLGGVLNQFLFDVDWGELDYLLIDLPPGTGDMQLSMVQLTNIDGAVIVTTPQNIALLDAVKGLKMFEQVKVPVIGIIENMSSFVCDGCGKEHFLFGTDGGKDKSSELDVNFLGSIPLEKDLRESADKGKPYMTNNNYEGRQVWKSYMSIAEKVGTIVGENKKGFFKKLFS